MRSEGIEPPRRRLREPLRLVRLPLRHDRLGFVVLACTMLGHGDNHRIGIGLAGTSSPCRVSSLLVLDAHGQSSANDNHDREADTSRVRQRSPPTTVPVRRIFGTALMSDQHDQTQGRSVSRTVHTDCLATSSPCVCAFREGADARLGTREIADQDCLPSLKHNVYQARNPSEPSVGIAPTTSSLPEKCSAL